MMDYDGFLVVGPSTEHLRPMWNKMFQRAGMDPQRVQFAPTDALAETLRSNPRVSTIFPLGEQALERVLGQADLFRWFGRKVPTNRWGRPAVVVPLQQPSLLLPRRAEEDGPPRSQLYHKPARFQGLWVRHLQHGLNPMPVRPEPKYLVDPPKHVWDAWWREALASEAPLSFDIETAYKMKVESEEDYEEEELQSGAMLRISFAWKPHHAVSVVWAPPYLEGVRTLLAEASSTIVWNGILFDIPRLKQEGYQVAGTAYDYQDGWHMLQSNLPRGLEFVSSVYTYQMPWKHLNASAPGLYSCIDADVALQNALGIKADLESSNQWTTFVEDSVELMPIMVEAGERGVAIDLPYSLTLKEEMIEEKKRIVERAASLAPIEIRPRKRYKRFPLDVEPSLIPGSHKVGERFEWESRLFEPVSERAMAKVCSVCGAVVGNKAAHLKGGRKNPCHGAIFEPQEVSVVEWDEILPFNLASSHQIKEYIRFRGLPMGYDRKTEAESANAKHIEKLVAKFGDALLREKLVESKLSKVIGTYVYCDRADSAGRIHSTYLNSPSTWRFAARHENLTNVGKRQANKWAVRARRQIIPSPGNVFVGADSTSIEAVVLGWLIGDSNFISIAKKSIHAYLVCADQGLPFTDENVELAKSQFKDLYSKFKTAVYLLLYGGDPYLMFMENPEMFPTKWAAEEIQNKIFALLPALEKWQKETQLRAKKDGYLLNPRGYRHYFYDVHTFKRNKFGDILYDDDKNPLLKPGSDAKSCLAFPPQNIAAQFGRETLRIIGNSPWRRYMPANVFVHDGYTLDVPESLRDEAEQFLVSTLCRPVPWLDNLTIGCETEYGYNWADQDPGKKIFADGNPNGMRTWRKVEC